MYSDLILHQSGENVKAGSPEHRLRRPKSTPRPTSTDPAGYTTRLLEIALDYCERAVRLHERGFHAQARDFEARARIHLSRVAGLMEKERGL